MSYLALSNGIPDFSKAVISFWFRVPKETLDAVAAGWTGDTTTLFDGITPLIVFGDDSIKGYAIVGTDTPTQNYTQEEWTDSINDPVGTYRLKGNSNSQMLFTNDNNPGKDIAHEPCYIGIDCNRSEIEHYDPGSGLPPPKPNVLRMNIQMSSLSQASGLMYNKTSCTISSNAITYAFGASNVGPVRSDGAPTSFGPDRYGRSTVMVPAFNPREISNVWTDNTAVQMRSETERFKVKLDNLEIRPDQWHHVLVSFDLSGPITAEGYQVSSRYNEIWQNEPDHGSVLSACQAWISVDDVNYKGEDLRDREDFDDYVTSRLALGPNDIVTKNAIDTALSRQAANGSTGPLAQAGWVSLDTDSGFSKPIYSYAPGNIKSKEHPVGIPATDKYVNNVRKVEMSEFQMWTNVTLNTDVEENRRAFIDFEKDEDGNNTDRMIPVDPTKAPITDDNPHGLALTEKLLKKKPEVLLHGSSNWKTGYNTGTTGVETDEDGNLVKIPEGQFKPVAGIEKYSPDPSLIKTKTST